MPKATTTARQFGYAYTAEPARNGGAENPAMKSKIDRISLALEEDDPVLSDVGRRVNLDLIKGFDGPATMVVRGLEDLGDTIPGMVDVYDHLASKGISVIPLGMSQRGVETFLDMLRPMVHVEKANPRHPKEDVRRGRPPAIQGEVLAIASQVLESGERGVQALNTIIDRVGANVNRSSFYEFQKRWRQAKGIVE